MENFPWVDAGAAVIILLSAILAYSRGFVRESMAILGWIGAAVAGFIFAPSVKPLLKLVPSLDRFLNDSCELSVVLAFAVAFAIALIIISLFTPFLSSFVHRSVLGGLDQGLGFLFGVVRGVLLISVALIVYDRAMAHQSIPMIDESRTAKIFANFQGAVNSAVPSDAPGWIMARYNDLTQIRATATPEDLSPAAPAQSPAQTPAQAPVPAPGQ